MLNNKQFEDVVCLQCDKYLEEKDDSDLVDMMKYIIRKVEYLEIKLNDERLDIINTLVRSIF